MNSINIIKSEHRNLAAVLYSVERLVDEIDQGKQVDYSVFHGLFTYIERFLDRYHHPKENHYLFPRLLERSPDCKDLIEELGREHGEGEDLFIAMLKALSAFEFSGQSEYPPFREAVLKYASFQRNHALKEEREILPLAQKVLIASDWEEIDAAFEENEDPMFGRHWSGEFSELFDKLIKDLPAPLGLGDVWKNKNQ